MIHIYFLCLSLMTLVCSPMTATSAEVSWGLVSVLNRFYWTPQDLPTAENWVEKAKVSWVREEFTWDLLELEPGVYNEEALAYMDRVVSGAQERNNHVLGLIVPSDDWNAVNAAPATDDERKRFADFAAFLAARYQGQVDAWEIWNEPNSSEYWKPKPNAYDYTALLAASYYAMKAVAPQTLVVGPTCAGVDDVYLQAFLAAGGVAFLDILSIHPYPYEISKIFENSIEEFEIKNLYKWLDDLGVSPRIWATEIGWPVYPADNGVSEDRQAVMLARAYLGLFALGVNAVYWYDLYTDLENNSTFGLILETSQTPRSAFDALSYLAEALENAMFAYAPDFGENGRAYVWTQNEQTVLTLWRFRGVMSGTVEIDLDGDVGCITDIYGHDIASRRLKSRIQVPVSDSPIVLFGDFTVKSLSFVPTLNIATTLLLLNE
ncbi:cellulase family glycosylhydrolase [Desulfovibrio inopinatus]|uniref:cellulase family glycosylhydrolase n=1 Tax=Desulfovibrio inopinatus TaxID=102109 RepID=UPI0003F54170|nr:cellulase family glycosylhydrolase [Desulfovibrio inopinatus]